MLNAQSFKLLLLNCVLIISLNTSDRVSDYTFRVIIPPHISSNAVYYVAPEDEEPIKKMMDKFLEDTKQRKKLKQIPKGKRPYHLFLANRWTIIKASKTYDSKDFFEFMLLISKNQTEMLISKYNSLEK